MIALVLILVGIAGASMGLVMAVAWLVDRYTH
jgi:hypothetical protein